MGSCEQRIVFIAFLFGILCGAQKLPGLPHLSLPEPRKTEREPIFCTTLRCNFEAGTLCTFQTVSLSIGGGRRKRQTVDDGSLNPAASFIDQNANSRAIEERNRHLPQAPVNQPSAPITLNLGGNWHIASKPYGGIFTIPEGRIFAAASVGVAETKTMGANVDFVESESIEFSVFEASAGVRFRVCCNSLSNCRFSTPTSVGFKKDWHAEKASCPKGTNHVLFVCESQGGTGFCAIDDIRPSNPDCTTPEPAPPQEVLPNSGTNPEVSNLNTADKPPPPPAIRTPVNPSTLLQDNVNPSVLSSISPEQLAAMQQVIDGMDERQLQSLSSALNGNSPQTQAAQLTKFQDLEEAGMEPQHIVRALEIIDRGSSSVPKGSASGQPEQSQVAPVPGIGTSPGIGTPPVNPPVVPPPSAPNPSSLLSDTIDPEVLGGLSPEEVDLLQKQINDMDETQLLKLQNALMDRDPVTQLKQLGKFAQLAKKGAQLSNILRALSILGYARRIFNADGGLVPGGAANNGNGAVASAITTGLEEGAGLISGNGGDGLMPSSGIGDLAGGLLSGGRNRRNRRNRGD